MTHDENNPEEIRRLFFGIEVFAPWHQKLPRGRLLDENHRHLTLAFLGEANFTKLMQALPTFPKPLFKVGLVGFFDSLLFLPERHPHVVAWYVEWLHSQNVLEQYHKEVLHWLVNLGFNPDIRDEFLPHVTICRQPFFPREWKKAFQPLPLIAKDIHLYESMGHLKYEPRWTYSLKAPFEEIEHTADIAFNIRAENLEQLYLNAQCALAFKFPQLLPYLQKMKQENLEEIIIGLNEIVAKADSEVGCPFKAISFHGELETEEDNVLLWEMIIDV